MEEPGIIKQFKREKWHNIKMTFLNWSTDSIKSLSKSCAVFSHSVVSNSLWSHGLFCPWDFPGKNTGVDCHFLLQGIFPTQGSNPGLVHCRQILYIWITREALANFFAEINNLNTRIDLEIQWIQSSQQSWKRITKWKDLYFLISMLTTRLH